MPNAGYPQYNDEQLAQEIVAVKVVVAGLCVRHTALLAELENVELNIVLGEACQRGLEEARAAREAACAKRGVFPY
ncbi:unnamed protein product, partial [marine sediment metagenome]